MERRTPPATASYEAEPGEVGRVLQREWGAMARGGSDEQQHHRAHVQQQDQRALGLRFETSETPRPATPLRMVPNAA